MAGLKRKFNNKTYDFYDSYDSKKVAENEAYKQKGKGNLYRITKPIDIRLPYYELWIYRKKN